jgi:hypothetical protein
MTLAVMLGLAGSSGPRVFPQFHGENTDLRWALSQIKSSRLVDGYIWTIGAFAIVIQVYPAPMDFRMEDLPSGFPEHVPWIPPVRGRNLYDPSLLQKVEGILRKSDVILILRRQNGENCVLNALSGERVFKQDARAQAATAVDFPCTSIWSRPEMPELSEADRAAISELLRTPPSPPKFIRRGN